MKLYLFEYNMLEDKLYRTAAEVTATLDNSYFVDNGQGDEVCIPKGEIDQPHGIESPIDDVRVFMYSLSEDPVRACDFILSYLENGYRNILSYADKFGKLIDAVEDKQRHITSLDRGSVGTDKGEN